MLRKLHIFDVNNIFCIKKCKIINKFVILMHKMISIEQPVT